MGVSMDQAEQLRIIKANNQIRPLARVIAVTSGKGGVGKSNTAINLAIEFRRKGKRVIILDADFGLANIEIMFGAVPKHNLFDLIYQGKNIKEIITWGPMEVGFISGGSGMLSLNNLSSDQRQGLGYGLTKLGELCDVLLIDTGAGVSDSVLDFVMAAPEVLLVTTPEPSAITDAYSLIKAVYGKREERESLPHISLIANKVVSQAEGDAVYSKLSSVTERFLGGELSFLGSIPQDTLLENAVRAQKIVFLESPASKSARAYFELANKLAGTEDRPGDTKSGLFRFFASFIK